MIESITLINFQNHTKTRIDLDPHVTTIVGRSDVGKSAIIRALRWVTLNQAQGVRILRRGASHVSVRLHVDGRKVVRKRVGSKNTYSLDGKRFAAFRSDVPEEIAKLLNISDINFQDQHDAPFWLSSSAGEVSRSLNRIVNLGKIDDSLAEVSRRLRHATSKVEVTKERLQKAKEDKKALDFVPFLARDTQELTDLDQQKTKKRGEATRLRFLVQQVSEHQQTQRNRNQAILRGQETVLTGEKWRKVLKRRDQLAELVQDIQAAQRKAHQEVPDLTELEELQKQATEHRRSAKRLRELVHDIQALQEWVAIQQVKITRTETKLNMRMKGRCPLCGQSLAAT